ncbi:metallophosphoesterase family protein [Halomicrococcus sp. NG-SE-24]|uniref:metallophosphoesterase family protein n=1 Tax=Halomicrococcus sp. NG-SE-24 TaxID=3436928 RepID=UPI003D997162
MRIAHAADIHLGHQQYGLKQRRFDARLSFQHFLSQAHEHNTDAIVIPGDLFDSRDLRPQTLQRTEEILEDVVQPIIVSPGNHDENMSRRRDLTWLQYLNDKGLITLLSAELANSEVTFKPTDMADQRQGGGGYVDFEVDEDVIRYFGLQYRGAYIERDLPNVAEEIQSINESKGMPDTTILLAHFGVDDAVPDLGATVARAALTELEEAVDYIALGHIHKQYESSSVAWNPGSLEAFDIQEGRWDDDHGYYIYDTTEESTEHYLSKRRPYYTLNFDVSKYRTFDDLRSDFETKIEATRSDVEDVCNREIHLDGRGNRRKPILNVRFEGTLLLDHTTFDVDALSNIAKETLDALYVQPTNQTERKAVQELLGELERDEAFNPDGTVNTDVLQDRVFTTIAGESRYSTEEEEVAETLNHVEGLVNEDGQDVSEVAEYLRKRRRELFPDGPGEAYESESEVQDDTTTLEVSTK